MVMCDKDVTVRCPMCENLFFPKRRDATYCSPKCRKRAQRGNVKSSRINKSQPFFLLAQKNVLHLIGMGATRSLYSLAIQILSELPDEYRNRVYEQLKDMR